MLFRSADWVATRYGLAVQRVAPLPPFRHVFTHFALELLPEAVEVAPPAPLAGEAGHVWQPLDQLAAAALPAPIRKLLEGLVQGRL